MPPIPSTFTGPLHPTARNYRSFLKFLSDSYGFQDPRWFEKDAPAFFGTRPAQLATKWALMADGRFAAHVGLFPFEARIEGRPLRVAGIGAVATHPSHRGQGLMKRLMDHVADVLQDDGYALSILWGERDLYRPYGYERGLFLDQFTFQRRNLTYFAVPGKVRPAASRDLPAIERLYNAHPFRIRRGPVQAASCFHRFDRPSERPVRVLEEKGKVTAYSVFWRPASFWKKGSGPLDVAEWGGAAEDLACLWASVLQGDREASLTATIHPGGDLYDWARENCSSQVRTGQSCMLKVLDLHSVLKAFEPQLQRRYEALGTSMGRTLWFRSPGGSAGLECGRRLRVLKGSREGAIPLSAEGTVRLLFGAGRPSSTLKDLGLHAGWLDGLFPLDWYWWRSEWI
ncbi:MAG TPA: GNAT family N-acetyltransferase [bacterium]|nr:GNAT family N-acetyltransferase [bacterium]